MNEWRACFSRPHRPLFHQRGGKQLQCGAAGGRPSASGGPYSCTLARESPPPLNVGRLVSPSGCDLLPFRAGFDQQDWYGQLFSYGMGADGAAAGGLQDGEDADANLVPLLVTQRVLPRVLRLVAKCESPLCVPPPPSPHGLVSGGDAVAACPLAPSCSAWGVWETQGRAGGVGAGRGGAGLQEGVW